MASERNMVIVDSDAVHVVGCRTRALDCVDNMVEAMVLASHAIEKLDECWLVSDLFFALSSLFFIGRSEKPLLEHSRPDWDWPALWVHSSLVY